MTRQEGWADSPKLWGCGHSLQNARLAAGTITRSSHKSRLFFLRIIPSWRSLSSRDDGVPVSSCGEA